ncbi:VOC family protein [Oerskovia sp. M15]
MGTDDRLCRAARLARFWALALGYREPDPPSGYATWGDWLAAQGVPEDEWDDGAYLAPADGQGPTLSLLKVPEPKSAKNRLHLDLKVSGGRGADQASRELAIRETVARLTEAGARTLAEHRSGADLDHVVMADPEGTSSAWSEGWAPRSGERCRASRSSWSGRIGLSIRRSSL